MYKILLLEDDKLFASTLEDFLSSESFLLDIAKDGEEALNLNYENNYDLYIFDINVPKINGLELLKLLRENKDETPTIFLTSYKDKDILKDAYLKGCDDYIKKPVDLDELILRIKAVLKRNNKEFSPINLDENTTFNPISKRVLQNGIDINLPIKVVELLELFLEKKDEIVSKEMIIRKLWSANQDYSEGSIRVYINQLKKIFKNKNCIKNIKGIGYKFEL
ncbi:response regulator transcription factor [Arcobacter vandammei]|uniref:response regulator transcription factor n=1 Tax=Arcobacter vandammei TaxID=2782243 RepID=UPI0018E02DE3|nr:response regulator transcription factor [Arcobacter vandammei]